MDTAAPGPPSRTGPSDVLLDGRWHLGAVIGRGAAADVYAATDTRTGDEVAVKVIRSAEAGAARRFAREVAALEGVDHPAIVRVLGHGTVPDGRPFVVLERAAGGTLHDVLAGGALGPVGAAAMGSALAEALDHAHGRGVVHRDVKPANVLLDGDGRPKLGDFGIARLVDAGTLTATGIAMGTPAYLAPEQVRGERVGPAADVYALGLVVLEAATGERAYLGDGLAAAVARLDHPVAVPRSLPAGLAATLAAMTAPDPADRPSAADAASRLAAVGDAGATAAIPVAGLATKAMPAAVPAAVPGPQPPDDVGAVTPSFSRRVALAGACFAAGFLAVVGLRAAFAGGDGGDPPAVPATTTTVATTTTEAPTTTSTEPERDDDRDDEEGEDGEEGGGRGNGNGGNGNGNGGNRGDD